MSPLWPRLAAIAVVVEEGHVLLVRRRNPPDAGLWGFPGGKADPGETIRETAARELTEETTLVARPTDILANLEVIGHQPDGTLNHHYHLVAVRCVAPFGMPKASDDVSEAQWFTTEAVLNGSLSLSKNVKRVLRLALGTDDQAVTGSPIT